MCLEDNTLLVFVIFGLKLLRRLVNTQNFRLSYSVKFFGDLSVFVKVQKLLQVFVIFEQHFEVKTGPSFVEALHKLKV